MVAAAAPSARTLTPAERKEVAHKIMLRAHADGVRYAFLGTDSLKVWAKGEKVRLYLSGSVRRGIPYRGGTYEVETSEHYDVDEYGNLTHYKKGRAEKFMARLLRIEGEVAEEKLRELYEGAAAEIGYRRAYDELGEDYEVNEYIKRAHAIRDELLPGLIEAAKAANFTPAVKGEALTRAFRRVDDAFPEATPAELVERVMATPAN